MVEERINKVSRASNNRPSFPTPSSVDVAYPGHFADTAIDISPIRATRAWSEQCRACAGKGLRACRYLQWHQLASLCVLRRLWEGKMYSLPWFWIHTDH